MVFFLSGAGTTTSWLGFSVAPVLGARASIRTMRAAAAEMTPPAGALARSARSCARAPPPVRRVSAFFVEASKTRPSVGALARSRARAPPPVRRLSALVVEASKKSRVPRHQSEPVPFDPGAPVERALTDGKHVLVAFDGDGARLFRTLAPPRASGDADLPALRLEPVVKYDTRHHLDPEGGSPARPERIERRAGALASSGIGGGGGGGGGGSPTSGATPGVGGGFPLTEPVLRGIVLALRELRPESVLVAAHGKGKSDGARALLEYARKHAPDVAERVVGEAVHLEGERGGRRLSEAQLLRAARRAYRLLLKPRVPLQARKVGKARGRKGVTRKVSRV